MVSHKFWSDAQFLTKDIEGAPSLEKINASFFKDAPSKLLISSGLKSAWNAYLELSLTDSVDTLTGDFENSLTFGYSQII